MKKTGVFVKRWTDRAKPTFFGIGHDSDMKASMTDAMNLQEFRFENHQRRKKKTTLLISKLSLCQMMEILAVIY